MDDKNLDAQSDHDQPAETARSRANYFARRFPEFSSLDDPSIRGTLDYTRNSVATLDSWIESTRPWAGRPRLIRDSPNRRQLFIDCGCYFGETIIRNLGGQWWNVRELKAMGLPADAFAATVAIGPKLADIVKIEGESCRSTYADPIGRVFRRLSDKELPSSTGFTPVDESSRQGS
jgi:hypothetical protein